MFVSRVGRCPALAILLLRWARTLAPTISPGLEMLAEMLLMLLFGKRRRSSHVACNEGLIAALLNV